MDCIAPAGQPCILYYTLHFATLPKYRKFEGVVSYWLAEKILHFSFFFFYSTTPPQTYGI